MLSAHAYRIFRLSRDKYLDEYLGQAGDGVLRYVSQKLRIRYSRSKSGVWLTYITTCSRDGTGLRDYSTPVWA